MNFSKFLRSVVTGLLGLGHAFRTEQSMRLHCVAAVGVVIAGFVLALERWEWAAVSLCIGLVISAECLNTAVERLGDRITQDRDPLLKQAKDCGSAAVLVLAFTAAVVGGLVFVPKLSAIAGY